MLEHLSSKFRAMPAQREPRAAIILNRFTRTLTVMYATEAVVGILGVTAEQFKEKSFYECIQENCLPDAIRCLESAKANDSIAYLRFWYRDPRRAEDFDEEMRDASVSSDSEDGGVELHGHMDIDSVTAIEAIGSDNAGEGMFANQSGREASGDDAPVYDSASPHFQHRGSHRTSSGESVSDLEHDSANAIFDRAQASRSSTSSVVVSPPNRRAGTTERVAVSPPVDPFEIEAVVSCTSDGLVVVMRRARPPIPAARAPDPAPMPMYPHGLFAAPWGANHIRPRQYQSDVNHAVHHGFEAPKLPSGGPPIDDFMNSIRDVAVFAWSLTGINGNIASYGHGVPQGEAQPHTGLPIWDRRDQRVNNLIPSINQAEEGCFPWDERNENANPSENKFQYMYSRKEQHPQDHSTFGMDPRGSHRPGISVYGYTSNHDGDVFQGPRNYQGDLNANIHGQYRDHEGSAGPVAGTVQQPILPTSSSRSRT